MDIVDLYIFLKVKIMIIELLSKPTVVTKLSNLLYYCLGDNFNPYKDFLSKHANLDLDLFTRLSGCDI